MEQEILFPSEKVYEEYLAKFHRDEIPYELVDEQENEDGTYTVVMRKPYNNNPFFRREPDIPDEQFKAFLQKVIEEEAEAIMKKVEADPSLDGLEMPPDSYEKLMEKIRAREKGEAL